MGWYVCILASLVPSPTPSFSSLAVRFTVLQATKSWAWDWVRGYILAPLSQMIRSVPLENIAVLNRTVSQLEIKWCLHWIPIILFISTNSFCLRLCRAKFDHIWYRYHTALNVDSQAVSNRQLTSCKEFPKVRTLETMSLQSCQWGIQGDQHFDWCFSTHCCPS